MRGKRCMLPKRRSYVLPLLNLLIASLFKSLWHSSQAHTWTSWAGLSCMSLTWQWQKLLCQVSRSTSDSQTKKVNLFGALHLIHRQFKKKWNLVCKRDLTSSSSSCKPGNYKNISSVIRSNSKKNIIIWTLWNWLRRLYAI